MTFSNDNQPLATGLRLSQGGEFDMLLNIRDVCAMTGLSRATIYRLQDSGDFVARIKLSPGTSRYSRREVIEWIAGKMKERAKAA